MLKRMSFKKILTSTLTLFALFLLYIMPSDKILKDVKQELEYVSLDVLTHSIYLLDRNDLVAKTNIVVKSLEKKELANYLTEVLIKDGVGESNIPSGFKAIIPSDTIINSLDIENDIVKIDFNKEFLDISKNLEEKMVEALVFSLTNIEGINKVKITIDGNDFTCLPISKKNIPLVLDRSFGVNKDYDISSSKNVESLTLYYINKYNDNYYYVPVTKYINNSSEKIEVIIEQLKNPTLNSGLMSFINEDAKLLNYELGDKTLSLVFNDNIFSDFDEKEILEEVIYTISMSISENYNIENVVFKVGEEEITKSVIKSIDCN